METNVTAPAPASDRPRAFLKGDSNELVARAPFLTNLWWGLGMTIFLVGSLIAWGPSGVFSSRDRAVSFGYVMFVVIALISWKNVFVRKIRLIVSSNGVWSPQTGPLTWDRIEEIGFKANSVGGFSIQMQLRVRGQGRLAQIFITGVDERSETIQAHAEHLFAASRNGADRAAASQ
ncbi:MAG: hypothetical protein EOO11_05465 [Chitinophagaceae bacterium]|nr:MAG: hypothetical protein EOO11_05465 [Chitinophagaceae bacterium]